MCKLLLIHYVIKSSSDKRLLPKARLRSKIDDPNVAVNSASFDYDFI